MRDRLLDRYGLTRWWTRDKIIAAIRAHAKRTGEPPTFKEWNKKKGKSFTVGRWLESRSATIFRNCPCRIRIVERGD